MAVTLGTHNAPVLGNALLSVADICDLLECSSIACMHADAHGKVTEIGVKSGISLLSTQVLQVPGQENFLLEYVLTSCTITCNTTRTSLLKR